MAVEVIFYTALAYMMSTNAVRQTYLRAKTYLDRGGSVILASLGLSLLFQKND
jgi:threonine/homoserine/homoserine lactone efflux protein